MTSIDYYNRNAKEYIRSTFPIDMSEMLMKFAWYLPENGKVLDAGCGSGRDSIWFISRGFKVHAHDGSLKMVEHCRKLIGDRVSLADFEHYHTDMPFDGIWACSSFLHVERDRLPGIVDKYAGFLQPGGVMYLSFKRREKDHWDHGRHFTNMTETALKKLVEDCPMLDLLEIMASHDKRPNRETERWVSVIARRKS